MDFPYFDHVMDVSEFYGAPCLPRVYICILILLNGDNTAALKDAVSLESAYLSSIQWIQLRETHCYSAAESPPKNGLIAY